MVHLGVNIGKKLKVITTKLYSYLEKIKNHWYQLTDKQKNLILASGISIFAIVLWLQYGLFEYQLTDDMGIYLYGGRELLEGNIPYVNIFEVKPPLTFFIPAGGLLVFSKTLGLSAILASRITMLLLGGGTVFFTYLLSYHLFKNRYHAMLSAIILLSFTIFGWSSLSGRPKIIMIFFAIACLYALIRKKWFTAGLLSSLSALAWQPGALLPIAVVLYSLTDKQQRKQQLTRSIIGAALPLIVVVIFFLIMGGLTEMINQTILFTITFKKTLHWGFISAVNNLIYSLIYFYGTEILFLISGFLGLIIFIYKERKNLKNPKSPIPFIFFPFIILMLYSLYDFQSWPDAIPLLPFIAIFASYFLIKLSKKIGFLIQQKTRLSNKKTTTYVTVIILILSSFYGVLPVLGEPIFVREKIINEIIEKGDEDQVVQMIADGNFIGTFPIIIEDVGLLRLIDLLFFTIKKPVTTLEEQNEIAEYVEANSNPDERLLFVAVPDIMFLSNRRNFNRYILYSADILYLQEIGELTSYREQIIKDKPPLIIVRKHQGAEYNTSNIEDFTIPGELELSEFINEEYEIIRQTKNYGLFKKK